MNSQVKEICYTVLRVFFGTLIASFIADATNLLDFHWDDWKPVVIAAIAAAAVVVINALNPKDSRYGLSHV